VNADLNMHAIVLPPADVPPEKARNRVLLLPVSGSSGALSGDGHGGDAAAAKIGGRAAARRAMMFWRESERIKTQRLSISLFERQFT
jgi:hypothetical protein